MAEEKKLEGLGGWLILIGFVIILTPIRLIVLVLSVYMEVFSGGAWEVLTTPGTEAYNPFWAPYLIGEIAINVGLVLACLFTVFLFFSKKKIFPKWFIGILVFSLSFILIDALAIKIVLPNEPIFDTDTAKEFARTLIGALIWIPYMLKSKRVKATFVK